MGGRVAAACHLASGPIIVLIVLFVCHIENNLYTMFPGERGEARDQQSGWRTSDVQTRQLNMKDENEYKASIVSDTGT